MAKWLMFIAVSMMLISVSISAAVHKSNKAKDAVVHESNKVKTEEAKAEAIAAYVYDLIMSKAKG